MSPVIVPLDEPTDEYIARVKKLACDAVGCQPGLVVKVERWVTPEMLSMKGRRSKS